MPLSVTSTPVVTTLNYPTELDLSLAASGGLHPHWESNEGSFQLNSDGTASQSGGTITGVGTTFSSGMVNNYFVFADGTTRLITAYTSPTQITVTPTGTVTSQSFVVNGRHAETPTFIPYNQTPDNTTNVATIKGSRVTWMGDVSVGWSDYTAANVTPSGVFGNLSKSAGGSAWNTKAVGQSSANATETFYAFTTNETNKEKAGGLAENATNVDPTNTGAPFLDFMWHLRNDGTAVVRHNGVVVGDPVDYEANDIFKVYKNALFVYFLLNGEIKETVSIADETWNLYPVASLKEQDATVNTNVAFSDTGTTKSGTLTFTLYGVFPVEPNYGHEINYDNKTLVSYAEDGTAVFRKKGGTKRSFNLQFDSRPFDEYALIEAFWHWHQKHLRFKYVDTDDSSAEYIVVHDSGLKVNRLGPDQISMTLILREV